MPKTKKKKLILTPEYKIKITEEPLSSVILNYSEKQAFKKLNAKSKLGRLNFLKEKKKVEQTLIKIISQSKYLSLYKDPSGFHVRVMEDLEKEELDLELYIFDFLKKKYNLYINEEINTGMSGDVSRILISKGTNLFE